MMCKHSVNPAFSLSSLRFTFCTKGSVREKIGKDGVHRRLTKENSLKIFIIVVIVATISIAYKMFE